MELSKVEYVKCNVNGAFKSLNNEDVWQKWWPQKVGYFKKDKNAKETFYYKGFGYQITEKYYNAVGVKIISDHSIINSKIDLIKINIDSVMILWKAQINTGLNPVSRFLKYREAKEIQKNIKEILLELRLYLENKKNIYGVNFKVEMSKDSTMVLIEKTFKKYPTTSEIYQLIANLKKYIATESAKENNYPMLHVKTLNDSSFVTMVAIPVNKKLSGNGIISFSRFVPWKVLTAEVIGGNKKVDQALKQMKIFMSDYQITAMAIPFEFLITDRSNEPDSSKWITRINTPIP